MSANVLYRIPAVRSREQYAENLRGKLEEPETSIFWDENRKGSVWNKCRILTEFLESEATHLVMLDDDADVVNRFKQIVEIAIGYFPTALWSFYSGQITAKEKKENTPYVVLQNYNMRGIGVCIPKQHVKGYLEFFDTRCSGLTIRGKPWPHDDCAWKMYALLNRIPVMTTIPNLVKDMEIKSTMGHHITKNSDCWMGYDVDVREFLNPRSQVCYDGRLFDLHVPKDHPLAIEIQREFARQKRVRKLLRGST